LSLNISSFEGSLIHAGDYLAILRTTPTLLGLYSLVTLWAHGL
jgi:hypothetical protein